MSRPSKLTLFLSVTSLCVGAVMDMIVWFIHVINFLSCDGSIHQFICELNQYDSHCHGFVHNAQFFFIVLTFDLNFLKTQIYTVLTKTKNISWKSFNFYCESNFCGFYKLNNYGSIFKLEVVCGNHNLSEIFILSEHIRRPSKRKYKLKFILF
jgi:hypothetical protein